MVNFEVQIMKTERKKRIKLESFLRGVCVWKVGEDKAVDGG